MFKKWKGLLSLMICISMLCGIMPITGFAAEGDAASVTFNGNTTYYTTIDAAWEAAVALDTTAENKATIQLLDDCKAENTLTNTADYLVLDTNGKTLTTSDAIYLENDVICGISAEGGSLALIGDGTITGLSTASFARAIILITGGEVYADGITIHNTGDDASISVLVKGGTFHFLDGCLISASEYALYAGPTNSAVYLHSGKIESTGRAAMIAEDANVKICCSDKPLYFVNQKPTKTWEIIYNVSYVHLEENARMDIEYSSNPDGSNSTLLKNVTEITEAAILEKGYLKIQTSYKTSDLFSTNETSTLLSKIKSDGTTDVGADAITAVHFVDLADYDLTDVKYSDYSANGDESVKAWMDGTELYIGGNGKIIAGESLVWAFCGGEKINSITGLNMLDTSNVTDMTSMFSGCGYHSTEFTLDLGNHFDTSKVTDMKCMFDACGYSSTVFTLNLGDKFDTSNVTDMSNMFGGCGRSSTVFTLDLGDKFDTAKVTDMRQMFDECGYSSNAFRALDLSSFTLSADTSLSSFAQNMPVTAFIFGEGWANAALPAVGSETGAFYAENKTDTEVSGATPNLIAYDWSADKRTVTFTDKNYYTITALANDGGTVSGGGTVVESSGVTLTATANDGYTFDGWYDGDTKVCETEEFVVNNVTADKTYTAKFTKNLPAESVLFNTYCITAFQNYRTLLSKIKSDGTTDVSADAITAVHFVDLADYDLTDVKSSDYSANGDGSVKAWMDGKELYIGGNGKIIAGSSLSYAFFYGKKIESITGLEMLDTSKVTDMSNMFTRFGSKSENFTLNLGNSFDTSSVTNMHQMFFCCGEESTKMTLELGDNFDTSNVTDMSGMFWKCGRMSKKMSLALGDKFDTSKVTDMSEMFWLCGNSSPVFTLDLGDKFDTSNVTYMQYMFTNCGARSTKLTLDLGNHFDTSKVIDMRWMFSGCGRYCPVFTLNLRDKFDTSKVTDMEGMFYYCGHESKEFTTLDLSAFTLSANTNLDKFASNMSVTGFIFGNGWASASLPAAGSANAAFYNDSQTDTKVTGATPNLVSYRWAADHRPVTFTDKGSFTITANAQTGGTVSGGGAVVESGSITLAAAANEGYIFDGWYDGDTKVCDTAEFVVSNVTADKTYTARFTDNIVYYTILAEVGAEGGGTVTGGGEVAKRGSVTITAAANDGYSLDGWYDGEIKVCDTAKFVVSNVTADKTYTAKFTKTVSGLFSTSGSSTLLSKIKTDGVTNYSEKEITAVHFVDLADYDLTDVTCSDYSANGDESVKAWMDGTELYIGGFGKITAGNSLSYAFYYGYTIDSITGLKMLDTSNVMDMSYTFAGCGHDPEKFTLDLGDNFDTSKVTDMKSMFSGCGFDCTEFILDLGDKFDTSNVTNMEAMFNCCGFDSGTLTLDLGDKFDTSNVTNMNRMFDWCARLNPVFTLDLGDKFNTSKVTDMNSMFRACGYNSNLFTLDLGDKFDTSNVTNMGAMFSYCGYYGSPIFRLDLGDKFDTSKVTNMASMFAFCGYDSTEFTLDLGDKFDTSSVTNMTSMFEKCGYNSNAFRTLDLSSFTLSADTSLNKFAQNTPITTFIFGESWANAKLPSAGSSKGAFYTASETDTAIVGATENLMNYDWASDNRIIGGSKPKTYTVTATAETGGEVAGGGEVADGGSITLTATANDGYTFDGWYDGDTKVCDTAEFVVDNVTEDKTYTAKFTKNQVVDPDPEPENPDIPYLKWDGSTLTLVKKADASCRVGIVYVGGATFDADNINWDKLVAAGKEYANLNGPVGYAVYANFTKRTPGTRGNYVAFVKYTKEDGTTTADYMTFGVKNAASFAIPALSYHAKTKTLKMTGDVASTIGIAYVGDAVFDTSKVDWNDFVETGKKYPNINGSSGYAKISNALDYTKTFGNNGNYVAFIKYFDENLNKSLTKYYTFTVADYSLQPTDAPFAIAEESQIVLKSNGMDVKKVTIVYIGTEDMEISNWNAFSAAAAKFSDINGKLLNQQYANPKDGSAWAQDTAGWYAVYIRYIKDGKTCNSYYTVELD